MCAGLLQLIFKERDFYFEVSRRQSADSTHEPLNLFSADDSAFPNSRQLEVFCLLRDVRHK